MNALEDTRLWLERAVIGLNLCPFARGPLARGQVRFVVSDAHDEAALATDLVHELRLLAEAGADELDTTLIVAPHTLPRFEDFNDFLDIGDALLQELRLEGVLQIASFHPRFRFEGTDEDDIGNATNRAPHPTLHLLREASVERAVASVDDAADIYERNIATLERLGAEGWHRLMAGGDEPGVR